MKIDEFFESHYLLVDPLCETCPDSHMGYPLAEYADLDDKSDPRGRDECHTASLPVASGIQDSSRKTRRCIYRSSDLPMYIFAQEDKPSVGCCCVYRCAQFLGEFCDEWEPVTSSPSTAEGCVAVEGEYSVFKAGVSCDDNPCEGDPEGTCCSQSNQCLEGGPGVACVPTGVPGDDGCYCDALCYTICFDCCGADARDCCLSTPEIDSLWDDSQGSALQKLSIAQLETDMEQYNFDMQEAWGAAMQSGTTKDGMYYTFGWARLSLVACLQEIADGTAPWVAVNAHQQRVREAATAIRKART
jgi:hypothetical protein